MGSPNNSTASLWQDYLFLTNEMLKFISRREMDMFYTLLEQRAGMQPLLEAVDMDFQQSPAGKELFSQLAATNQRISDRLKLVYNQAVRQLEVNQSYEGAGLGAGARLDVQR